MLRSHGGCVVLMTFVLTLVVSAAGSAQTPEGQLTVLQMAVACAPPPVLVQPSATALRIVGSEDAVTRSLFGNPERLVVNGGSEQGMEMGQQFFVRRPVRTGSTAGYPIMQSPDKSKGPALLVRTSGWVRVVGLHETTATVSVDHLCGEILKDDYLERFEAPIVAEQAASVDTSGELDFTSPARVLFGDEERRSAGVGDFMLIDRGTDEGAAPGARFAVYRDLHVSGVPLNSIGEATVVSTGPRMALVRINQARDAVYSGDYVVPRKP